MLRALPPQGPRRHGPQPVTEAIAEPEPLSQPAAEEGEAQEERRGPAARRRLAGEAALRASQAQVELGSHEGRWGGVRDPAFLPGFLGGRWTKGGPGGREGSLPVTSARALGPFWWGSDRCRALWPLLVLCWQNSSAP